MGRAEVKRFQRAAEEAAAFLKPKLDGNARIKIVSHTDADGITSAAILARCLYSYNVPFTIKFGRAPNDEDVAKLGKDEYDLFIFLDQGSSQLEAINRHMAKRAEVMIIDHHPGTFPESSNVCYLNPHTCGLNGAIDVSASGAVFSMVEQIDLRFRSLIGLAIVGAIGDRQESFTGFTGVNDTLLKRAIDLGLIHEGEGLRLTGRTLNPVVECLRTSTRPYIIGMSGNSAACRSFVDDLGIPHSSLISELGSDVERRVRDALLARVGALASNEEFRKTIWGGLYTAATDDLVGPRELGEYMAMLDACANLKKSEIGFAVAAGDGGALADALTFLNARQEQMLKAMAWLVTRLASFKLTSTFRYIDFGDTIDSSLLGETLSLAIESGLVHVDQPVIGLADTTDGIVKVSSRSTYNLAVKGFNLGQALSRAAAEVGGYGGGHDVSAAARIPREHVNEFISKLDQKLSGSR